MNNMKNTRKKWRKRNMNLPKKKMINKNKGLTQTMS